MCSGNTETGLFKPVFRPGNPLYDETSRSARFDSLERIDLTVFFCHFSMGHNINSIGRKPKPIVPRSFSCLNRRLQTPRRQPVSSTPIYHLMEKYLLTTSCTACCKCLYDIAGDALK